MYIQDIRSCPLTIILSVLWLTYFTKSYYLKPPLMLMFDRDGTESMMIQNGSEIVMILQ